MKLTKAMVVVRGGGDLASGVIYRLKRAGFPVIVTELAEPLVVRRTVSFAEAVFEGMVQIEGLTAQKVANEEQAVQLAWQENLLPVLVDPAGEIIKNLQPQVVIDAIMAKRNVAGTKITDAPLVIGLGPGFRAGVDVHAVIETKRGHFLGRVIYEGEAEPNTGIPGIVNGVGRERVVYAPGDGIFRGARQICEMIDTGEIFGWIDETPVYAAISGCIRGMLRPGIRVKSGVKIGDIDPRKDASYCHLISDKALSIGGGVLEAVLAGLQQQFEL